MKRKDEIEVLRALTQGETKAFIQHLIHALTIISRTTFDHANQNYHNPSADYAINEIIHHLVLSPNIGLWADRLVDMLFNETNGIDSEAIAYAFKKALNNAQG